MTRVLAAIVAAAALALSPPAKADGGEELIGLLLGIGAVYAIGKGIERARAPEQLREAEPQPVHELRWRDGGYRGQTPTRRLPRDCLATFDTWHGEIRGFAADCLARSMHHPGRLPSLCAIGTRVGHRDTTIYSARCLQLEGWEIAERSPGWRRAPEWRGGGYRGP